VKVEGVVFNALRLTRLCRLMFAPSATNLSSSSPPSPRLRRARREADPPPRNCGKGFTNIIENRRTFRQ
jgi:hypothetical protein